MWRANLSTCKVSSSYHKQKYIFQRVKRGWYTLYKSVTLVKRINPFSIKRMGAGRVSTIFSWPNSGLKILALWAFLGIQGMQNSKFSPTIMESFPNQTSPAEQWHELNKLDLCYFQWNWKYGHCGWTIRTLLKFYNVNDNLPMEKSFLNLRVSYVWLGFQRGRTATKNSKGGAIKL